MARFYLRGWIGVHKEGIPPGPEFLIRLLLCLKETDFTPVPLLVVCPDLSAFIHPYDDLHSLSPCTHVLFPLLDTSPPASCPPPRSSLTSGGIWFWGLVTLQDSVISSPSSLAFFPSWAAESEPIMLTIISKLTIFVNIIANLYVMRS